MGDIRGAKPKMLERKDAHFGEVMNSEQADGEDNDPWTSFGFYSDADIVTARALLEQVGPDGFPDAPPSLTPHHL
jgi:hypothetical protein